MRKIQIEGSINKDNLYENFKKYLQHLDLNIKDLSDDKGFRIGLEIDDSERGTIYNRLAIAIEELIVNDYIDKIIKRRVDRIYPGEYGDLDREITDRIKDEVKDSDLHLDEKIEVREELVQFLRRNNQLNIDGYIRFRLSEHVYILDVAIDSIITEVEEEKRLEDFINMIKYFMDIQNSKIDILHVIIDKNDFRLTNAYNEEVGQEIVEQVYEQFEAREGSKSDVLLSTLITMAPKMLIVHFAGDKKVLLIQAIVKIFGDRVSFCDGCNICKLNLKTE